MSFFKTRIKRYFIYLSALSVVLMMSGCDNSSEIQVKPDDSAETELVTEELPVETEPAVTEPETVQRTDLNTIRIKPAGFQDEKYSALSDYEECYTIADNYYEIVFPDDKLFQSEINKDIRDATDELRKNYSEDIASRASRAHSNEISNALGVAADIICRNGILSIMLEYGYYEPYSHTQAGPYSVMAENNDNIRVDYAVTLNYSLATKNKIYSISDLFYENSDWSTELTNCIYNEYNGNVSYFPEGEPELFTSDYVLVKTEEDDYAVIRYNSSQLNLAYCENMIFSHYYSMNDITSLSADKNYERYSSNSNEMCGNCQMYYTHKKFYRSRFYSDSELASMNEELEKLYDNGFLGRENHECFSLRNAVGTILQYNPDSNIINNGINAWSCSDDNYRYYYYDPYTYDLLNADSLLGNDWLSYAVSDNSEFSDLSTFEPQYFNSLKYLPEQNILKASVTGYSSTYQCQVTVTASVPAENANQNYLAD